MQANINGFISVLINVNRFANPRIIVFLHTYLIFMRKYFICLLFLAGINILHAQDSTKTKSKISPSVKQRIGKAQDRIVIDLCLMNALFDKDGVRTPKDFKVSGFSRGINAYFMWDVPLGKKKNFAIAPGAGIGSENYYFKRYGMAWHKDSITRFYALGDSISSKKSKLNMTYFDIPLEVRYRSTPNAKTGQSWKLALGFKLGFLLGSKWKYVGEDLDNSGENVKFKDLKVANMAKLRYGVYIRGGYSLANLFFYYSLSETFNKGKGPTMHPLVFGISINGL